jgi:hypothetical protein
MPLAAPNYFAGALDPQRGAQQLFTTAGWIRRRCNEVLAEADLDILKIYDLASNCFLFRQEADKWRSGQDFIQVHETLVAQTRAAGTGNAIKTEAEINADYKALYQATGAFLTWATPNLPAIGATVVGASVIVNRTWPNPDFTVRVAKLPAVTAQVTTLRAVFD